jgi:hypothetical protein
MLYFDDLPALSIFDLMKSGNLAPGSESDITINVPTAQQAYSITLHITTKPPQPHICFSCTINGKAVNYVVNLTAAPMRISNCCLWYFVCPVSGTRCRKLYLVDGYFMHRNAINGAYYQQTLTSSIRSAVTHVSKLAAVGKMMDSVNAPYFRKTYANKPTRRYSRILKEAAHL